MTTIAVPAVGQGKEPAEKEFREYKGWCKYQWDTSKPVPARLNLPSWACDVSEDQGLHRDYDIDTQINPFFLTGDFDGDGTLDIAIRIRAKRTKKIGVAIIHGDKRVLLFWAGNPVADYGDDIAGLDQWTILPKGQVLQTNWEDNRKVTLTGEAPVFIKSESAAFALYWDGKKYVTYQISD